MSRPLTREDWRDPTRLQRRDGVPVDECHFFETLDHRPAMAVCNNQRTTHHVNGIYKDNGEHDFDIILKPEVEALEMAQKEVCSDLDWSDLTKLQSRHGVDVTNVHIVPEWAEAATTLPVIVQLLGGVAYRTRRSGMCRVDGIPNELDIIPKPQPKPEPRSMERWVSPCAFYADGIEYKMRHKLHQGYVRVRITEVVE